MNALIKSVVASLLVLGLLTTVANQARGEGEECACSKTKTCACPECAKAEDGFKSLFDGKTLKGWEGDKKLWMVENGVIVGRSPGIRGNKFLCTKEKFENFELRVRFRLVGGKGNSGFQIRSEKLPGYVKGYQADVGAKYWGWLYDERRRGKLAVSPPETKKHYKPDGWNDYLIRCQGPNIELKLNGFTTVKYTEKDPKIPRKGIIGPQLHGGPPMEIQVKYVHIKTLPEK